MLELKTLEFSGIRRFVEKQTIDFTNREKLIQVDGENLNTGGSSGAGKTTIFLALDYLLGISDIPATALQSRLTKDPILVVGYFSIDGKSLKITRGKKTGLIVELDGNMVSGNVKLAEETLQQIIGLPTSIFKKMVHKKQKEGGFFIGMTGKATYDFLSEVMDLSSYNKKIESIKAKMSLLGDKASKFNWEEESFQSSIERIQGEISDLSKPTNTVNKADIVKIEAEIASLRAEKLLLDVQCASKLKFLNAPIKEDIPFDTTKIEGIDSKASLVEQRLLDKHHRVEGLRTLLGKIPEAKTRAKYIGAEISKSKTEMQDIEKAMCPTCKQSWVNDTAKAKIFELSNKVQDLIQEVLPLKDVIGKEQVLQSDLNQEIATYNKLAEDKQLFQKEWEAERDEQRAHEARQAHKYSQELREYSAKEKEITSEFDIQARVLTDQIHHKTIDQTSKQKDLDSYTIQSKKYEEDLSRLAQSLSDTKGKLDGLNTDRVNTDKELTVASESQRAVKAYILQTFQDTLDMIGDMATQILSGIPNMANSTIYFEGCKENKDGSIKDEVTGIINMDGENIPIKTLSGGERTAIDLAVDLAVIDVIETKAGKGANFYIIDEPFDGLDSVCRENCLEILKQIDTNKSIIMVDHSTELKEMINEIITVVREGETSKVLS
jgi:DNA repair exonuclease SbcCD ATPase subunit